MLIIEGQLPHVLACMPNDSTSAQSRRIVGFWQPILLKPLEEELDYHLEGGLPVRFCEYAGETPVIHAYSLVRYVRLCRCVIWVFFGRWILF